MKKALHDKKDTFLSFRDGKIKVWDSKDVYAFLDAANDGLELVKEANKTLHYKGPIVIPTWGKTHYTEVDGFCVEANDLIATYLDDGATEDFINEINEKLSEIRYQHMLMPSKDKTPDSVYLADFNKSHNVAVIATQWFANLLAIGGLNGLKRCQMPDCERYFIGRSNAKWCSKTCGSRYRVRRKRKRDIY